MNDQASKSSQSHYKNALHIKCAVWYEKIKSPYCYDFFSLLAQKIIWSKKRIFRTSLYTIFSAKIVMTTPFIQQMQQQKLFLTFECPELVTNDLL